MKPILLNKDNCLYKAMLINLKFYLFFQNNYFISIINKIIILYLVNNIIIIS